jgi:hypothetical protein
MTSYILAYCLKNEFNGKATITDHFEVFCEYGEMEETPLELAEKRLQEIEQDFSENETFSLYTWNIAEIVKTSEHYETENSDPVEEAKAVLKENGYFMDNLWCIEDVKGKYDCTDEQAQGILYQSLTNEATMDQIQFSIDEFARLENLPEKTFKTFAISGYWKDDKVEFEDYIVSEAPEENDEDEDEDEEIFHYGFSEQTIKKHIALGEGTWLEFVITSYSETV